MTTRGAFRQIMRETLSDHDAWPDMALNVWINEAIREYGHWFPRQAEATINCVALQRSYDLSECAGILGVLRVEYPKGRTPPRLLERRPEAGGFFGLQMYDLKGDPPVSLVIGESPGAGEQIGLTYTATQPLPASDASALAVPDHHLEGLKIFIHWQALRELELGEAKDPDKTTMLLNMLGLDAYRAERAWRSKMNEYLERSAPGGYTGPWRTDRFDPIY